MPKTETKNNVLTAFRYLRVLSGEMPGEIGLENWGQPVSIGQQASWPFLSGRQLISQLQHLHSYFVHSQLDRHY